MFLIFQMNFLMAGGAGEVPAEADSVCSHTAAQRWVQLPLCRHPDRGLNQPQSHTVTAGTGNTYSTPREQCTSMNEWFMSIYVVCRVWSCVELSPCTLRICSLSERRGWCSHPVKSPCFNKTIQIHTDDQNTLCLFSTIRLFSIHWFYHHD